MASNIFNVTYTEHVCGHRANQQMELLNTLQSYMLTPQVPRCGGFRRSQETQMPPSTNTMNPLVVSYLASSRLGSLPAAFGQVGLCNDPKTILCKCCMSVSANSASSPCPLVLVTASH